MPFAPQSAAPTAHADLVGLLVWRWTFDSLRQPDTEFSMYPSPLPGGAPAPSGGAASARLAASSREENPRPSVALVDDETLTRATFGVAYPALCVAGTYATVSALLADKPEVDLVVLDLLLSRSPDEKAVQGPRAISLLAAEGYRVCLHTDEQRNLVLAQCFAAGAICLARKSDSLADNSDAFLRAARG